MQGGDIDNTLWENMWQVWKWLNDPAAHTDEDQKYGSIRFLGFIWAILGILVMSILLGFIVDLVSSMMEELRKGKSKVVEKDHTLILGWSDKLFGVIVEICSACETMPDGSVGGCIVILADVLEKVEMDETLYDRLPEEERLGTRFQTRYGSPMLPADLRKVSASTAKSIVVLCDDEGSAERADAAVLRVIMNLSAMINPNSHVVAELRDKDSEPLLRLVGGDCLEVLVSHDIVGRLMIMAVRQPGLAKVYDEILGFDGDEFYVKEWPETVGMKFGDLIAKFPGAIVCGIRTTDHVVVLKPDCNRICTEGECLVVIAEDDDTYDWVPSGNVTTGPSPPDLDDDPKVEKMLMIGWRRDVRDMLLLIEDLATDGSEIHIFAELDEEERIESLEDSGMNLEDLKKLTLVHHVGGARRHLEKLPVDLYTSCLIVADESKEDDAMSSDSQVLANLLLFRDVQMKKMGLDDTDPETYSKLSEFCPTLCETLDSRTQKSLAMCPSLGRLSEFVQSSEMVSRSIAMVSEERSVNHILNELLGGSGAGLEVLSPKEYIHPNEELSFMQLAKRLQSFDNEVLLGYQQQPAINPEDTFMNPRDKDVVKVWDDMFLIIMRGPPMHPHLHEAAAAADSVGVKMMNPLVAGGLGAAVAAREVQQAEASSAASVKMMRTKMRKKLKDTPGEV